MNKRINILFVSSYIDLGGGETALLNLVDNLDAARYLPHLLVRAEGQLAAAWRKRGWPVYITPWRGQYLFRADVVGAVTDQPPYRQTDPPAEY